MIRQMDLPALKAFVSPRSNFSLRAASNDDQFKSSKTKISSKDKGRCPSSRLMKTSERGVLNQYIKDLQGSIVNECRRIQEKIKSVHEKVPSSLAKENIPHNAIFKSCQNLKKFTSKTLLDKASKQENSLRQLKKEKSNLKTEDTLKSKHKSKELHLDKIKPNLQLSQESDWMPNRKLEGLLSNVYTTTNAVSKNFEKQTPKPKIIRNLFHNKMNSQNEILIKNKLSLGISMKDFKIIRKLGKGRFGNVYLTQEKTTGFLVALKSIQKKSIKQSDMLKQLKQEIKIQLFLDHPNILKMYGFFDDSENIYLILEAIPLGNVFRELKEEKRFSEKKSAGYLKQVCEALGCLHNSQILHRDIKPENILNGYGILKLSDFGWSIYSPEENRQTFCGTLDYVSPEIVVGKSYDFMVDVWSIGVLAFEFATGHAPFENKGGNQDQTYQKILRTKINYPQYVSEGLRDFINRILVKNPKKRMSLGESISHQWLLDNCKGSVAVSKSIFNSYLKLM